MRKAVFECQRIGSLVEEEEEEDIEGHIGGHIEERRTPSLYRDFASCTDLYCWRLLKEKARADEAVHCCDGGDGRDRI